MKKINTSKVSGTQELTPSKQAIFNSLKSKIENTYRRNGYLNIETPSIERTDILLAKAGGETEKQIYNVYKTTESPDKSNQALRFDHTVPLARYIVEYENDLTFPFKVSQTGLNFRGERAQKGRFREFYQCDIDIIGRDYLPLSYDADIIYTLIQAIKSFELGAPIIARISNRKILSGMLEVLNLTEKAKDIFAIVDRSEKVPAETTKSNLEEIGLTSDQLNTIISFTNIQGKPDQVLNKLRSFKMEENSLFQSGVSELERVVSYLIDFGEADTIIADMRIVRGLDYYTGTVFEFNLKDYKEIGSICGGGRYENLASNFTDKKFPGVGGSIGLTRLFYTLDENNLLPENSKKPLDYAVIPMSENELSFAFEKANKLRDQGFNVDIIQTDKKLSDKIAYASKLAENGIVIGEEEKTTNIIKAKNYTTGETAEINL